MKKPHVFIALGVVLLFISGTAWATERPDALEGVPAILASLDQTGVTTLDDNAIADIRGQADYVLVRIFGINTFDWGPGVRWTLNPLGYRYGNYGGYGYGDSTYQTGPVDQMDGYFMAHDFAYDSGQGGLAADVILLSALCGLADDPGGYWGTIYNASPPGAPAYVKVSGVSLIGGKFFFGWRPMPYSEYSRREAMAGMGALVFGRSLLGAIQLN